MILGISGKIGSGKDLAGEIIQFLTATNGVEKWEVWESLGCVGDGCSPFKIKKFADKLKDIVCLLIGCTREQLEDRKFKETPLGVEWRVFKHIIDRHLITPQEMSIQHALHHGKQDKLYEQIDLTPRLLLQLLGTEAGRKIIHPNVWINATMNNYKYLLNQYDKESKDLDEGYTYEYPDWIITDVRFPSEAEAIKEKNGFIIRLTRGQYDPKCICGLKASEHHVNHGFLKAPEHESETALDDYEFDYVIDNSGTIEELIIKIKDILIERGIL